MKKNKENRDDMTAPSPGSIKVNPLDHGLF